MGTLAKPWERTIMLLAIAAAFAFTPQLCTQGAALGVSRVAPPLMFFGPKGEPVAVELKTFNGVKSVKGRAGQKMIDVTKSSGLIFGCKSGECGSCEAKLVGRVVRPCVAKLPNKPTVKIDVTNNKLLKSRRSSNF